ncbi:hypothetical protein LT493_11150 [Streptomyces tricolor]|nr:hypothetical protein [Streptomyces tricolor]
MSPGRPRPCRRRQRPGFPDQGPRALLRTGLLPDCPRLGYALHCGLAVAGAQPGQPRTAGLGGEAGPTPGAGGRDRRRRLAATGAVPPAGVVVRAGAVLGRARAGRCPPVLVLVLVLVLVPLPVPYGRPASCS